MDRDSQNSISIREKAVSVIESLPESEIEVILPLLEHISRKGKFGSTEGGWRAFMEMGGDGLGSKLHNVSEGHDKYLYQEKKGDSLRPPMYWMKLILSCLLILAMKRLCIFAVESTG